MAAKLEQIERLQSNLAKQQLLVAELAMWAKVEAQGIDPDTVQAFTLCEAFLSKPEREAIRRAEIKGDPHPYSEGRSPKVYNAVRMKDGTLRKLDPMIERPR